MAIDIAQANVLNTIANSLVNVIVIDIAPANVIIAIFGMHSLFFMQLSLVF